MLWAERAPRWLHRALQAGRGLAEGWAVSRAQAGLQAISPEQGAVAQGSRAQREGKALLRGVHLVAESKQLVGA